MSYTKNPIDLTGKKFDRLTVIKLYGKDKNYHRLWLCQCNCGNTTIAHLGTLLNGHKKSCGCKPRSHITHNMSKTRFHKIWKGIKYRCINKNNIAYKYYGGRGIKICDRWLKFKNFRDDMYQSYLEHVKQFGEKNTTIERKNNNGNYELNNPCVWATKKEQGNNRKTNHLLTFNGQTLTIAQWGKKLNINSHIICSRINEYGWSTDQALSIPVRKRKSKISYIQSIL